jgi:hypothetical protein
MVVDESDALEQDAAARRLGDGELDLLVREHPAGTTGPGVVARFDQDAVDVDAVGARPTDVQALVRAMWAIIREVVVLPLVPVTATTGTLGRSVVVPGPGSHSRTRWAASSTS